jgi:hypothetical protein
MRDCDAVTNRGESLTNFHPEFLFTSKLLLWVENIDVCRISFSETSPNPLFCHCSRYFGLSKKFIPFVAERKENVKNFLKLKKDNANFWIINLHNDFTRKGIINFGRCGKNGLNMVNNDIFHIYKERKVLMLRKRNSGWFLIGAIPALTLNLFTLQAAPAGFVTVSGANFMLKGKIFRFGEYQQLLSPFSISPAAVQTPNRPLLH